MKLGKKPVLSKISNNAKIAGKFHSVRFCSACIKFITII